MTLNSDLVSACMWALLCLVLFPADISVLLTCPLGSCSGQDAWLGSSCCGRVVSISCKTDSMAIHCPDEVDSVKNWIIKVLI